MEREKEMDIMLAIGILYVLFGHNYQPSLFPFPANSFHMALFFFISGYFFVGKFGLAEKFRWIGKKAVKFIIPYYILNLFFFIFTLYLNTAGITLSRDLTWFGFFIEPWLDSHQYGLFGPAWFITQLFLVHLVFQLIYVSPKRRYSNCLLLALLILAFFGIYNSYSVTSLPHASLAILGVRTSFALLFYSLGHTFYNYKEKAKKFVVNPITVVVCIVLYALLSSYFGPVTSELVWAEFHSNHIFTPILSAIFCIIIFYNISCAFASLFPKENFVYKIGQNTFAIMVFHLLIFFLINYVLFLMGLFDKSALSINAYFHYDVNHLWFVYTGLGIAIPTLMSLGYKKLKTRLNINHSEPFIGKSK